MIEKIGKYTVTGEIGRGAMGMVYKGVDPYITIGAKVTGSAYNQLPPGHLITGSYPITSSVSRKYFPNRLAPENMRGNPQQRREQVAVYATSRNELIYLKNTMNYYKAIAEEPYRVAIEKMNHLIHFNIRTETIRYRIYAREMLVDNLSQEDAFTIM